MYFIQRNLKIRYLIFLGCIELCSFNGFSQGLNHNWLIGYTTGIDSNVTSRRAILQFDQSNISIIPDDYKMAFLAAQANISDSNGNLILATNGCWIANSTMDTMMNGSGLNPNSFTTNWCTTISGIPYVQSSIVLPYPDDTTKYILFHQTGNNLVGYMSSELYYSIIDMNLDGGLGGITQKNVIAIQDTLNPGITACKHANGRDWWIVILKDSTDIIYKILLTPTGVASVTSQTLGMTPHNQFNCQIKFSPDGKKFAYHHRYGNASQTTHEIRIFDFNRCNGMFSNGNIVTTVDPYSGFGLTFSPNSKYVYFDSYLKIYQFNSDTSDMQASLMVVALNDTFYSPFPPYITDFWHMYLAANGKIYISSGSSVIDLHYINFPDSGGFSCDVQMHALPIPCWSGRGNVNHPNYYLGCDTTSGCPCLITGIEEQMDFDFNLTVSPNPNTGNFSIAYLLPQNKHGMLEIHDLNGKIVYEQLLPPWSTLQLIQLPENIHSGIYNCSIISDQSRINRKIALIR